MMNGNPQVVTVGTGSTTRCKWMDPYYRGFWFIFSYNIYPSVTAKKKKKKRNMTWYIYNHPQIFLTLYFGGFMLTR